MSSKGFTLIELITVITIIAVLSGIGLTSFRGVQSKARDSTRKNDLRQLSVALELYKQNNNGGYYSTGTSECSLANSDTFYSAISPFMSGGSVPSDPLTQNGKYCYFSEGTNGQSFRLFAKLENCSDKDVIDPASCSPTQYNFSVASQDLTIALGPTSAPTAAPTAAPTPTCTQSPPQTFVVAASGDDGFISISDATYPPSENISVNTDSVDYFMARKRFSFGLYDVGVGLVRWNTSSIPDNAEITSATFRGYVVYKGDVDNRSLTADWYTAWPIDSADFTETAQTTALSGVDITSITLNATNDFTLQNVVANISKTGYTGLRFHISGGVPSGNGNEIQFTPFDHPTNPKPTLVVNYDICS
ncbi:hypothetical protein A3F00_03170 [Candidatus Daviesbacteria bacterium RIFCSPHIGHO2_12_FULL_37_11]|uniref:Type II secretion system protein GspG C-terminal domain-containing protein n=1 Tax=Candidatus Daviesbacteria bacterium RIFCSPHIGHO2_12_FULL_37_11 TaxID=1797777 RepID=A0A1F5KA83_9BACT|nr:MAG: hypothetical protein A3F00_03170 [Candidatus Daviesbacteria bacterium RIFCSPHIGHO2_12_FULL_37_11]